MLAFSKIIVFVLAFLVRQQVKVPGQVVGQIFIWKVVVVHSGYYTTITLPS
ncbi:hypothetical protein ES707_21833 [subsurface metagenome]